MENLKQTRDELLRLHKTLMNIEKESYENAHGTLTPNQLLQLLLNDEKFAWLRTISTLIVEIDEMFASKKRIDIPLAGALLVKCERLFDDTEEFAEFKTRFQANLDTETAVGAHHQKIIKLLRLKKA